MSETPVPCRQNTAKVTPLAWAVAPSGSDWPRAVRSAVMRPRIRGPRAFVEQGTGPERPLPPGHNPVLRPLAGSVIFRYFDFHTGKAAGSCLEWKTEDA